MGVLRPIIDCFNSTLVRLEGQKVTAKIEVQQFQFHFGTIRSSK